MPQHLAADLRPRCQLVVAVRLRGHLRRGARHLVSVLLLPVGPLQPAAAEADPARQEHDHDHRDHPQLLHTAAERLLAAGAVACARFVAAARVVSVAQPVNKKQPVCFAQFLRQVAQICRRV